MKVAKLAMLLSLGLLLGIQSVTAEDSRRWYNDSQVKQGELLFARHCAACHGNRAQGLTADWKKVDADGNYPPPPLNGSAHAWHHSLDVLRRTIREGGARLGGVMPGFSEILEAEEMDAVIAFFQAYWNDKIYQSWLERNGESGFQHVNEDDGTAITRYLEQRMTGVVISRPVVTPVKNILQVRVGNDLLYISHDGEYAFVGELIDLKRGDNLTARARQKFNQQHSGSQ